MLTRMTVTAATRTGTMLRSRCCFYVPSFASSLSSSLLLEAPSKPASSSLRSVGAVRSHYSYSGPGHYHHHDPAEHWSNRDFWHRGFTVGVGGPVGSGKTALVLELCRRLPSASISVPTSSLSSSATTSLPLTVQRLGVVTNDIFTQEDAEFLVRHQALPASQIAAVETGGCPHAAIREDVSANLTALETLTSRLLSQQTQQQPGSSNHQPSLRLPPLLLCESGGDNLAAHFAHELADVTIYVIDVAGGDKVPRKGGPGITQADVLVINKIDLAAAVGANLEIMKSDAARMRNDGLTVLAAVKQGVGLPELQSFIVTQYEMALRLALQKSSKAP